MSTADGDFLLTLDLLPLRVRGLAATELPIAAAGLADALLTLESRAATVRRLTYVLAEHDWDLAVVGGFMLEARRYCPLAEVERLLVGCTELAMLATVYLEDRESPGGNRYQRELFWAEDESRLVAV